MPCGDDSEDLSEDDEDGGSSCSTDEDASLESHLIGEDFRGEPQKPVRLMLLVMMCMFQGYAAQVGVLQQKYKKELGVGQFGEVAKTFTAATVFVHWGKLVARLGHNVIFACFTPIARVYISMGFMFVGCIIPPYLVFELGCKSISTVFVSYGLAGIGLGVFECTFLNVITPLGKLTKSWAIMGIPFAFATVNILGLICTSLGMPVEMLYWYIVLCIPIGMLILFLKAPSGGAIGEKVDGIHENGAHGSHRGAHAEHEQASLLSSLQDCSAWLPPMLPHILAKVLVNFVMENYPASFYTYNAAEVPLWRPSGEHRLMNHDLFFALLFVFVLLGDSISRRLPYFFHLERYSVNMAWLAAAVFCAILGFLLESLAIAVLSLLAVFLLFWGNGLVYGVSTKYIDRFVPEEHNLAAYSFWCFLGDAGAIAGGSMVDVVRNWICGGHEYKYECLSHN